MLLAGSAKKRRSRFLAVDDGAIWNALPDWTIPEYIYTKHRKHEFLDQLQQMVEDNITIFEETLGIELKESPQYDIGQLYERLVDFHNKEISKAVLTVTLTTEIEGVGSYKASEIHREMLSVT